MVHIIGTILEMKKLMIMEGPHRDKERQTPEEPQLFWLPSSAPDT